MQACAIEAGLFGKHDVVFKRFVGWCCPLSVGIISLIEHQALIVWLVVQVINHTAELAFTHSRIRAYIIYYITVLVFYGVFHVVEERAFGRPCLYILNACCHKSACACRHFLSEYYFPAVFNLHLESGCFAIVEECGFEDELFLVEIGSDAAVLQATLSDGLKPHRRPYTGHSGVETFVGIKSAALLSSWLET